MNEFIRWEKELNSTDWIELSQEDNLARLQVWDCAESAVVFLTPADAGRLAAELAAFADAHGGSE